MNERFVSRLRVVSDHFRGVTKLIVHGKGGEREIDDFMLASEEKA